MRAELFQILKFHLEEVNDSNGFYDCSLKTRSLGYEPPLSQLRATVLSRLQHSHLSFTAPN